ncbi:S1C family serine protease [Bacillus benzoevorans]|uniref:S1-C subfamily serine protease n=1 Tax=Bacillus benzoevorans TaxID=1456 RepID=A0A7X0HSY0_9BACI|nr:trypsin-like peptidase domain-containing protein [Bacillus benzoevorans]MBB6445145.1 S1-C subfamily serine protease [Bacillus benzoevorans]
MKKVLISLIITLLIWGAGAFAFFFIKEYVPKQLKAASDIVTTEKEVENEKEVSQDLKEVIHNVQKLVVKIQLEDGSLGSGFVYNNQGDVVTNAHVVANTKDVTVVTADSKELPGTVIGIGQDTDVAVVRVPGLADTEPLKVARERKGEIGDEVLALGSPLGYQNTVTTGIISGIDRDIDIEPFHYEDAYQISAPIAPGNSGGPLVDSKTGEVLGINSAGLMEVAGSIGFSIPITSVLPLIDGWVASPMTDLPAIEMGGNEYAQEEEYSLEEYSNYLVQYFYESLNYGDYVTAYSLLGASWQSNTTYDEFRKGYLNTLAVKINDITASASDNTGTVTAVITAQERKDSGTVYSQYKVNYKIGYENDQLVIISGAGEKLE